MRAASAADRLQIYLSIHQGAIKKLRIISYRSGKGV